MAANEEVAELVAGSVFFAGLPAEAISGLAQAFKPARYENGQEIFGRGDAGSFLLIVAQGRVRLSLVSAEGREVSVRHAGVGDIVGEIAVLDGMARSATATALGATRAYVLFRADFQMLVRAHPDLSLRAIEWLCTRLRATTEQLESIALHPIEVRLARFLLVALGNRKAPPGKRVPLELGFSQSELAQLLGASRPKVNGALALLEGSGAVKRTADRLFCDPALLAQTAGLADEG